MHSEIGTILGYVVHILSRWGQGYGSTFRANPSLNDKLSINVSIDQECGKDCMYSSMAIDKEA